jgi:hypothetical protein
MTKKEFKLEDFCKPEVRIEHYCRYTFPVLMQNINCPYYKYNLNPILSECTYKKNDKK